jgi:hypothetical protein
VEKEKMEPSDFAELHRELTADFTKHYSKAKKMGWVLGPFSTMALVPLHWLDVLPTCQGTN